MANAVQILDKIERNLKQRGITAVRVGEVVEAAGLKVSYVSKDIQKPMGGIDDQISPFLGIGVGNPGSIQIEGTVVGGLDKMFVDQDSSTVLVECSGFANDIQLLAEDGSEARIAGHADVIGVGS